MGRSSQPPLNSQVIRQARIRKFLTQEDVQRLTAELGHEINAGNLSRIERGKAPWPTPRSIPVLARVLGLIGDDGQPVPEIFLDDPRTAPREDSEAA